MLCLKTTIKVINPTEFSKEHSKQVVYLKSGVAIKIILNLLVCHTPFDTTILTTSSW